MTNKKHEALIFVDDRPTSINDDLYQWASDAEDLIRRQHARIVELKKENSYLNDACAELEAMTQHTYSEQERLQREDFEQWSISTNQGYDLTRNQTGCMRTYEQDKTEHAWRGFFHGWMQEAARRAAAVPTEITYEMSDAGLSAYNQCTSPFRRTKLAAAFNAMLSAAPQPPEATIKQQLTVEAAPVQLPEPVAKIEGGSLKWNIPDTGYSLPVRYLQGTQMLYTEQQVMQLLAAHGITLEK